LPEDLEEMFDAKKFEELLRNAALCLDDASDMLDAAAPADIAPPGAGYLLARIHLALEIVEMELPEFKEAAKMTAATAIADSLGEGGWRGATFGAGKTKL
jgi:hypothetical protein